MNTAVEVVLAPIVRYGGNDVAHPTQMHVIHMNLPIHWRVMQEGNGMDFDTNLKFKINI